MYLILQIGFPGNLKQAVIERRWLVYGDCSWPINNHITTSAGQHPTLHHIVMEQLFPFRVRGLKFNVVIIYIISLILIKKINKIKKTDTDVYIQI